MDWMSGDFKTSENAEFRVMRNYSDSAGVTRQDRSIWFDTANLSRNGILLDVSEAIRVRDHLNALINDVLSRRPKLSDGIAKLPNGSIYSIVGDPGKSKFVKMDNSSFFVKDGSEFTANVDIMADVWTGLTVHYNPEEEN